MDYESDVGMKEKEEDEQEQLADYLKFLKQEIRYLIGNKVKSEYLFIVLFSSIGSEICL